MGYTVGWFALADSSAEETAAALGYDLGEPCVDVLEGMAIGQLGGWTLVYNDGEPLLSDAELQAMSADRTAIVHESIDSVMYARTTLWNTGRLSWSALVNLDVVDDDDAVVTTGLSNAEDKALRTSYDRSAAGAYDDIAQLAKGVVGFRHDQVLTNATQFRKLIDNRPQPASTPDRTAQWLVAQGFEAKDPDADGSGDRTFRRDVDDDFSVIVRIDRDRYQFYDHWCDVTVGIRHEGAARLEHEHRQATDPRELDFDPFGIVGHVTATVYALSHPPRPRAPDGELAETFADLTGWLAGLIEEATAFCTSAGLARICRPWAGLAVEAAVGWSDRSESYLEQAHFLNTLRDDNAPGRPSGLDFFERYRSSQRSIERVGVDRSLDDLRQQLESHAPLSGPELAVLQADAGATGGVLDALQFEHWMRVFSFDDASPKILVHVVRHHLFVNELSAIAGKVALIPAAVQLELAEHDHPNVPSQLGRNPTIDAATQIRLAELGKTSVGVHPALVAEAQHLLVDQPTRDLARNPVLLRELQPALATSKDSDVREGLARNPTVLPELLEKLLKDRKGDVKSAAASNPQLPEHLQRVAAEKGMALSLGYNPNLAESVQRLLVERGELVTIAHNPALVEDLMHRAAASENRPERTKVAGNPALPRELQEQLATDPDHYVRDRIAFNPGTHADIRARLQNDEHAHVAKLAKKRAIELGEQPGTRMANRQDRTTGSPRPG